MTDRRQWCDALFATIDSMDSRGFASFLTADASFRYGSAPPVINTAAIVQALDAFFGSVARVSHSLRDVWDVDGHVICRGEVRYTRHDGRTVSTLFCNVFTMRDEKIAHYDIYLDPTALFAR